MAISVIDHRGIDGPIDADDPARRESVIEHCAFSNQGESVSFFDERLQFGGMRRMRINADFNACDIQKLKESSGLHQSDHLHLRQAMTPTGGSISVLRWILDVVHHDDADVRLGRLQP